MQRGFRRDRNYDPNKLREVSLLTKIFSNYNENKKVEIFIFRRRDLEVEKFSIFVIDSMSS